MDATDCERRRAALAIAAVVLAALAAAVLILPSRLGPAPPDAGSARALATRPS